MNESKPKQPESEDAGWLPLVFPVIGALLIALWLANMGF